ncbi:hypothetical protein GGP41_002695 [Bipolaris sorokiniana]|uniref:Ketoreductase (KR) domain-containing protein n=2 Tax=Cochliobolus sativus TaxID=45130 RepID=A0A8H6DVX9_COCSA|nr:uncharacterized protein COCSADRAFT_28243 [Bipolaris sorokiniana ND90Pr]EMD61793.1 hypothetical protein COCSADRAFT_28243 [Bipolaris sorokiniana ND90Pr]KAF5850426.1 hypothetical protein GGP41_002695 [Bipolaris sorokiniana]
MSPRLRWAVGCVAAAWILSINRNWLLKALNQRYKGKPDPRREIFIVTGGATGIGVLVAQKLDAAGATVVVIDVSRLSYTPGRRTSHIQCDVSDVSSVEKGAAEITRLHGTPTTLVANAGIVRGRNLLNASDDDLRLTFGVNAI